MAVKFECIKYGATGVKVKECQKQLQYAGSKIKADGKYGIAMVSAVRAFQKKNGLAISGIIDAKTFKKLSAVKKPVKKTAKK